MDCTIALGAITSGAGSWLGNAVDGDMSTRCFLETSANVWPSIAIDLGKDYPLASVTVDWEYAHPDEYEVQLSDDGSDWTTVASGVPTYAHENWQDNGYHSVVTSSLSPPLPLARHVQIVTSAHSQQVLDNGWSYSIWEITVCSPPSPPLPPSPPPPPPLPPSAPPSPAWPARQFPCRFAVDAAWQGGDTLETDVLAQDAYITAMLQSDGRFATRVGAGITAAGLTCDHQYVNADGSPGWRGLYTAGSKESLHIGMLALVVSGTPLAWHWIDGAEDAEAAATAAVSMLNTVASAYERHLAQCPACGGFLAWKGVSDDGFDDHTDGDSLHALDNGQLAWSMVAAAQALDDRGEAAAATRYTALVATMAAAAPVLFVKADGGVAITANILDVSATVDEDNREQTAGSMCDPFEGELMIMFIDLLGGLAAEARDALWASYPCGYSAVNYEDDRLPNGPITVQRGWRYSTHEAWKYLVLPYLEVPLVKRLVLNCEKARTWNAKLRGLPGLLASVYIRAESAAVSPQYRDTMGIVELSSGGYTPAPYEELSVTPYAAYSLILAERGMGLAWHRAMLARPLMQSTQGSVDSSEAYGDARVATIYTWDAKVTTNLASLGGLGGLLGRYLSAVGKRERFDTLVAQLHETYDGNLLGEETPIAPPPNQTQTDGAAGPTDPTLSLAVGRDFALCAAPPSPPPPPLHPPASPQTPPAPPPPPRLKQLLLVVLAKVAAAFHGGLSPSPAPPPAFVHPPDAIA